jgi:Straboviridae/Kyanoviridae head completion nuclease
MAAKKKKPKRRRRVRHRGIYHSTKMNVDMTYRSGWELKYFIYLDADPNVTAFISEGLKIPYLSNKKTGKIRNYIPDLLVEYADKTKKLIEIKPSRRVSNIKNKKKFAAAIEHCKHSEIEFVIVTEHDLKHLGLL